MSIQFSASSLGTRNVGQGGGPNLLLANAFSPAFGQPVSARTLDRPAVSTADYYHIDGFYWSGGANDLNAMGSWGQAIATAKGCRYVWLLCADHPAPGDPFPLQEGWGKDSQYVYAAFSNDPVVPPDPSTMKPIICGGAEGVTVPGVGGTGLYNIIMFPCLVYNPDDASNKAYIYTQGIDSSGAGFVNSFNTLLHKGNDFDTPFTTIGISHAATGSFGFVSAQTVYRNGTGDWISYGAGNTTGNDGSLSKWTSTDGVTFTNGSAYNHTFNSRVFSANQGSPQVTIAGQLHSICSEDARSADGGMYVSQVPVNASTGAIITTGSPPIVRISSKYQGIYPGPTYLQQVAGYVEDGIYFAAALHGFFSDVGLVVGAPYSAGGGLDQQYLDFYAIIVDATAAANAAPCGVRASCSGGVAAIQWNDVPAGRTYRVYRGTTLATQATLIGDVTGTSITDSPTVGSVYYYKVVALNAGVEQASRIVSTYVS